MKQIKINRGCGYFAKVRNLNILINNKQIEQIDVNQSKTINIKEDDILTFKIDFIKSKEILLNKDTEDVFVDLNFKFSTFEKVIFPVLILFITFLPILQLKYENYITTSIFIFLGYYLIKIYKEFKNLFKITVNEK